MESYMFSTEVIQVKDDPSKMNSFIEKNEGFIKYSVYKAIGKFISKSEDEYSIALSAFLEAIEAYDQSKGAFSSFAQLVIKRRLLDHIKSGSRHNYEICVEPEVFDGDIDEDSQSPLSFELREKSADISYIHNPSFSPGITIKDEIEAATGLLLPYGFSFFDLIKCSPTAIKTKKACAIAVKTMLSSEYLFTKMKRSKALPMKELSTESKVTLKTLERYRRYIIAVTLILSDDYPQLSEYMKFVTDILNNDEGNAYECSCNGKK